MKQSWDLPTPIAQHPTQDAASHATPSLCLIFMLKNGRNPGYNIGH
jgi:hypothetical protein